ncbi:Ubiquitin-like protein 3 [Blattella germanica]|nr:Ubiquitin-like protein 3 [Blattella germanica]
MQLFILMLQINLRLILVSGKTKEFLFSPSDSAGDIAQTVFDNWPEDWAEEAVAKAEILRLIYQGRFLHSNVTLGALGLPFGKTTVMHLVPRENLPEPNSQEVDTKILLNLQQEITYLNTTIPNTNGRKVREGGVVAARPLAVSCNPVPWAPVQLLQCCKNLWSDGLEPG